jgi:HAE1 family hydrophobic/amphiphilic exporter-1
LNLVAFCVRRPVFTTMVTLIAVLLGIGEGAEAQAPLARAVIDSLAASTVTTLLLIPIIYTLAHGRQLPPSPVN